MAADHPLLRSIEDAFARRKWSCSRVAGKMVVESAFEAHHTRVRLHVQAHPEINAVEVVGYLPHPVPTARLGLISEALMRLNHTMTIGNFEMDVDAGQVFFRAANLFPVDRVEPGIVAGLVHSAVAEVDRLTPFLTLLLRMAPEELAKLNLKLFLQREDLLPPVES